MRWLFAGLTLVPPAGIGGVGVWAYAHRGYPDVVYYAHYVVLPSPTQPQVSVEEWVDPQQHRIALRTRSSGSIDVSLSTGGFTYEVRRDADGTAHRGAPTRYGEPAYQVKVDRALLAGGWPRLYRGWTSHHRGPIVRMRLAGHRVLRFTPAQGTTVWLDVLTGLPVQVQVLYPHQPPVTDRFVQWNRLAPDTLPATFFDPPSTRRPLWDRLADWVHAHLQPSECGIERVCLQ